MPWNPLDDLSSRQKDQLDAFSGELTRINRRINLVAQGTIPHLEQQHIIHSLTLAYHSFPDGSTVVDFGAGGGFPTIPLAIRFPEVEFIAVDTIRKKTEATRLFARRLQLDNVDVWNGRAESWEGQAHYAVSRATAPLPTLWNWSSRVLDSLERQHNEYWAQGLIALKGGDIANELSELKKAHPAVKVTCTYLGKLLQLPWFEQKQIVHVAPA